MCQELWACLDKWYKVKVRNNVIQDKPKEGGGGGVKKVLHIFM